MQKTGEAFRQGIPSIQTCADSLATYFKRKNAFELFSAFLNGMSAVAQFVEVLQGSSAFKEIGQKIHRELEAQTGLTAPEIFAKQVHKVIVHEASVAYEDGVRHFHFLYHPDTDWHGYFFDIVSRNPVGTWREGLGCGPWSASTCGLSLSLCLLSHPTRATLIWFSLMNLAASSRVRLLRDCHKWPACSHCPT
jgi:hypothetical protein